MKKIFLTLFFVFFFTGAYAESEIGIVANSNDMRLQALLTCNGKLILWASADDKSATSFSYDLINQELNGAPSTHCVVCVSGPSDVDGTMVTIAGGTIDVVLDHENRTVSVNNAQFNPVKGIYWRNKNGDLEPTIGWFSLGSSPAPGTTLITYTDDTALDGNNYPKD